MSLDDQLRSELLECYGPMVGGPELIKLLGFKTYTAFYRTWRAGDLGVQVFHIPGRRGLFALTQDVAAWMSQLARPASPAAEAAEPRKDKLIE